MSEDARKVGMNAVLLLVGALSGIGLLVLGVLTLALTGQLTFFVMASFDSSVWTDETKFVDGNATAGVKTKFYIAAEEQIDKDIERVSTGLNIAGLVVTLAGLAIIVTVFFLPKFGLIALFRGASGEK